MIQRIQSVYLFLVVILGVLTCCLPLAEFTTLEDAAAQRAFTLTPFSLTETTSEFSDCLYDPVPLQGIWGFALSALLIPVLALVIIFLYRNRKLQVKLTVLLILFELAFYAVLALYVWLTLATFASLADNGALDWSLTPWAAMPLVCVVLSVMASRRILADEALVRAADRIR